MLDIATQTFWGLRSLGEMPLPDRAAFYEGLERSDVEKHLFLGSRTSHLYENPRLELAILEDDWTVVPAQGYTARPPLSDTCIDLFLERYYAAAMPGRNFDLQLAITSRHHFQGRNDPERIAQMMGHFQLCGA